MKAITTRYHGATEHRPARIIASDQDGNRITLPADGDTDSFPYDTAHQAAAVALCAKMGWPGAESLVGGSIKGSMVWVFTHDPAAPRLPRCGDTSPAEGTRERTGPYRCTLPAGHDGDHAMTTHPLEPTWPGDDGEERPPRRCPVTLGGVYRCVLCEGHAGDHQAYERRPR